jgi:DNA-binding transcriptional LysR family regulator
LDTRYLKSLISVVESGSIAEAARLEGLTAAAISQRIQALERALGVELLSRAGHAAVPTIACRTLLPRARRIVGEMGRLAGDADPAGLTGSFRIGSISTALTGLLTSALRQLTQNAPRLQPVVVPGTARTLYRALQEGELDAAIVVAPPFPVPKSLDALLLRREPLLLISQADPGTDIAAAVRRGPYIRYDPDSWGGQHAERYLSDHGGAPAALYDLDALEAIALLVGDGVGVSLVPDWSGLHRLASHCRITSVSDERYDRRLVLLSQRSSERPQMVELLKTACLASAAALDGSGRQ